MRFERTAAAIVCIAVATPSEAATSIYSFSGTLDLTSDFGAGLPEWKFQVGQAFSGLISLDSNLITSQSVFTSGSTTVTRYYSPILSLSYTIDLPSGPYSYSPPSGSYSSYGVIQTAGSVTGSDFQWQNYPIPFDSNPFVPVPSASHVGPWVPHAHFLSTDFTVRFTDPDAVGWTQGREVLSGIVSGKVTYNLVSGPGFPPATVPESATWAMMILGFGVAGAALRRRNSLICKFAV